jgi:hypothetical protein
MPDLRNPFHAQRATSAFIQLMQRVSIKVIDGSLVSGTWAQCWCSCCARATSSLSARAFPTFRNFLSRATAIGQEPNLLTRQALRNGASASKLTSILEVITKRCNGFSNFSYLPASICRLLHNWYISLGLAACEDRSTVNDRHLRLRSQHRQQKPIRNTTQRSQIHNSDSYVR